jgi:hypothetical protein
MDRFQESTLLWTEDKFNVYQAVLAIDACVMRSVAHHPASMVHGIATHCSTLAWNWWLLLQHIFNPTNCLYGQPCDDQPHYQRCP